ncbi:adenylate/guanylate cyclase domain-containing protein [Chloroflexota bacterium]
MDARLRIKSNTDELRATQELIRRTFERFVPAQVVQELLENPEQVQLGGQLQSITVCFADLEGFTSFSEDNDPQQVLTVLNQYHSLVIKHLQAQGGTIDKFLGDGVLALYNTPLSQPDHVSRSIQAALNIRQALPKFYEQLDPIFHLKINFGIHTGEALVGLVGADELMDYTAIGDTVNLASRLEDLSHNGQILVSETVYQLIAHQITAQCLGSHTVKNRTTPVTVYAIEGLRE